MLYEHRDEAILDPRDDDLLKLKYDYFCSKVNEATELIEKQIALIRANDELMADLADALEIVKAKRGGIK